MIAYRKIEAIEEIEAKEDRNFFLLDASSITFNSSIASIAFPMSGHSKWANIRVKKTAQDARRGKIFTRHARLIEIAARAGGGDSRSNAALRTAIENAKLGSVPNVNIDRAVKKGTGESKGEAMGEIIYAAKGTRGTAYLIECLTDNRNRTLSNVKLLIQKCGGSFAESSSVLWMFGRKGVVSGHRISDTGLGMDELELALIDAGAGRHRRIGGISGSDDRWRALGESARSLEGKRV